MILSQIKKISTSINDNKYLICFCACSTILFYGMIPMFRFDLLFTNPNYNLYFLLPNWLMFADGLACIFSFSMLMPRCNF